MKKSRTKTTPRHHKLFWGSSYDRGLSTLLLMWPKIKEAYPDATLSVAYGWDLFLKAYNNNPERMQWKETVDRLMSQDGIKHHGRVGKKELRAIREKCGIWAYPTLFTEIFCITALESQLDGLVPVTMTLAALKETAKPGILIDKDIKELEAQDEYLEKLLDLMGDKKKWTKMSKECNKFALDYSWEAIAYQWIEVFNEKKESKE